MVHPYRVVLVSVLAAGSLFADGTTPPASYIIQTVAGSDASSDGGPALSAALSQPEGIAVDRAGNVYFADAAVHRVRKIAKDGTIHTVAGTGIAGFAGDGGPASAALLNQPYGLAIDAANNLYIADLGNSRIRRVGPDGTIQTVAGGGTFPASGAGQGGPAMSVQLNQPRNVAVDHAGTLYISDFGANQVYQVGPNNTLTLIAGTGSAGFAGVGTSALLAELKAPAGIAVDPSGAIYFADSANNRVRKVYNGVIINVFNTPSPTGVVLDSSGMLYVAAANYFGSIIQQISSVTSARDLVMDSAGDLYFTTGAFVMEIPSGGTPVTIAGSGTSPHFGGDGGQATSAQLDSPSGIAIDSSGNWYIADTANNRIRKVTAAGVISTVAGNGDPAELNGPRAIAIDAANNLYIADTGNNAVRKLAPGGSLKLLTSDLNNPVSLALDSKGSLYVADSGDNRIVQVKANGTSSTYAQIDGPLAVAVDASGNVFAADATQIWKVSSSGKNQSLIGGLTSPGGLSFAADGSLWIADTGANAIRRLDTSGVLTTIAGTGAAGLTGDGNAAAEAELTAPAGIAMATNGTILIADSGNNRIRSLTPTAVAPETAALTVENAASLVQGAIAPDEIITVYGAGFDKTNTQLLFDGAAATLFYVGATQINALAPAALAPNSTTNISVIVDGAPMGGMNVPIVAASPGIFTVSGGTGQAAANNQDGSVNSAANPAARGAVVSLYATGPGSDSAGATVTIGGYAASVLYAGPAPGFPGLMQVNAQIPGGFLAPGIQPVLLSVGGASSQTGVTLAIK